MLIRDTTFTKATRSFASLLVRLPISVRHKKPYTFLTPSVFSRQTVYDRRRRKLFKIEIRDSIDLATAMKIYLSDDYDASRLKRYSEIKEYYSSVLRAGKTPLILDCGGNIGIASQYFSQNYDEAKILCIEPDPANLAQAKKNNPSSRAVLIEAAVGSQDGRGRILDSGLGNNAYRIAAAETGSTEIVSIETLLHRYGEPNDVPFIAKIDIEGFEADLFSKNVDWIEKFPLLIIELHDWMLPRSRSSGNFLKSIAPLERDFVYFGETIFSISNTLL